MSVAEGSIPAGSPTVGKPSFEQAYPEVARIVQSRRNAWTYLSMMPWEDVSQELLIRAYSKWEQFDPAKGPLENWLNTLITHALHNLRRDLLLRTSRPCIGGGKANGKMCEFNRGGDSCAYTPSRTQCAECPVYAKWEKSKQYQHNVKSQVSLENHIQEVHNMPDDSVDTETVRHWVHREILRELSRWEGRIFRLTIIQELPPTRVVEILSREVAKRKRPLKSDEQYNYSAILQYKRMFKGMMRVALLRGGYIGEEHMDPNRNNAIANYAE